jgi:hypothetical protein
MCSVMTDAVMGRAWYGAMGCDRGEDPDGRGGDCPNKTPFSFSSLIRSACTFSSRPTGIGRGKEAESARISPFIA